MNIQCVFVSDALKRKFLTLRKIYINKSLNNKKNFFIKTSIKTLNICACPQFFNIF